LPLTTAAVCLGEDDLQEEAMADPRQLEGLVQQVQRLPQRDEYWVGTHRLARMWVTSRKAPPYRPYVTLVLSQEGKIVRSQVQRHPPTAQMLFEELVRAMRRPVWGAGRARRPTRLYVDHPEDVAALTPWLAALQVQCVYRHPLALADAVIADMERSLGPNDAEAWAAVHPLSDATPGGASVSVGGAVVPGNPLALAHGSASLRHPLPA
jgi:hypothetical protein